ncbi:class I SAM-dependent DNA methyltransferase [Rhodococcus marinonascens]|uniref:class I SAM-dependent DNA methyltransferase n=1 Tax=Rhodococcus marinonascens TaxID=38311 RepID=UPI000932DD84|nr:class I SAM-dependent methyltransferase [Rhodococcus marinonascens]
MTDIQTVRDAYDNVAVIYAARFQHLLDSKPLDRAMLAAFAELVQADGARPVADLGCGPGRLTSHLLSLGLDTFGVDLSPEMIRLARQTNPAVRFSEGSMDELDICDGTLGGVLAWYSIIHTPPQRLPGQFAEFYRVLGRDGHVLLAFQAADEPNTMQPFDHKVAPGYRWSPGRITELLHQAGFDVTARLVREAEEGERTQHAYLLATKRVS